eukprot:COSAG06_NODE_12475_length_1376_cov_1.265466_2_plen_113_part_00
MDAGTPPLLDRLTTAQAHASHASVRFSCDQSDTEQAHRQPEIATASGAFRGSTLSLCRLAAVLACCRAAAPALTGVYLSSGLVSLLSSLDYDDGETYRHDLSEAAWRLLNKH